MNNMAFFYKGDTLLIPADFPDSGLNRGIPLELAKDFEAPDIFEIPALDGSDAAISAVSVLPGTDLPANWKGIPVRRALAMFAAGAGDDRALGSLGAVIRACHIAQWRQDSRFCGRCGAENCDAAVETPVRLPATPFPYLPPPMPSPPPLPPQRICPECGRIEFPRICPAVIVVITDDEDRILLAHNKKFRTGVYSHISGFNEAGESLEETAAREIREEVNIEVKDITYVKSQPWPFPDSLMLGFKARYASGTLKPDGIEIEDAGWFTRDNLPDLPGDGSLSRFFINRWLTACL